MNEVIERRHSIQALEQFLLACEQAVMPLEHFFAAGLYARKLTIPKNCCLTGAIHKQQHINIIVSGDITVVTDQGPQRIKAPAVIVSEPGTKRAGFAHEETIWITVHATQAKDATEAEAVLVTNSFEDYERFIEEQRCLLQSPVQS